jgi:omega-amidase
MSANFRTALLQSPLVWEAPEANLEHFAAQIAALPMVDLIVLPEMFATGFTMQPETQAEEAGGPAFQWLVQQALAHQTAICGSLAVKDGDQFYNRCYFVHPDGSFDVYNKRHLFTLAHEEQHYTAGNQRTIVHYKGFRVLLQVCYDLRFPVFSRNLGDYDMAIYVANWPERRHLAWQSLLPARAIENQCYVIAVNRIGLDGNGMDHAGHSAAYDFEGKIIASIPAHETGAAIAQCDLTALQDFRKKFPFLNDADRFRLEL